MPIEQDNTPTPIEQRFAEGLDLLIHGAMSHNMHLTQIREALLKEAAWCEQELKGLGG